MRNNQYYILFMIALLPLLMAGCSKKELIKYNEQQLGSSIFFYENDSANVVTSKYVAFGQVASDVTDSVVRIPVCVTGSPVNSDRTFAVQFADTSTMVEGVDFDYYRPAVIRAGMVKDTLMLVLHRTAQMRDSTLHLDFVLTGNENFNTAIPYYYNSGSTDSASLICYRITSDDIANTSYIWTSTKYKAVALAYFGTYSLAKVQLMMSVLQLSSSVFFDSSTNLVVGLVLGWASYMKSWLAAEKLAGRIYYDENGVEITMGASA